MEKFYIHCFFLDHSIAFGPKQYCRQLSIKKKSVNNQNTIGNTITIPNPTQSIVDTDQHGNDLFYNEKCHFNIW